MLKRLILIYLLPALSIAIMASYYFMFQDQQPAIINGRAIEPSRPLGEFELLNTDGTPFTRSDLLGQWTVLSFGFTHCPDVCPATLAHYRLEMEALDHDERTRFIFVSVDPERDKPQRLREYVNAFHPDIKALTGTVQQLQDFARLFGAYFEKEGSGPDYNVAHTPYLFLISPEGHWSALYTQPFERGTVAMDLRRLIR